MDHAISFSATISACEKGGQWEQALTLLHKICDTGMTDSVISLNAVILACEQVGHWEQALTLLRKMRQRHDRQGDQPQRGHFSVR